MICSETGSFRLHGQYSGKIALRKIQFTKPFTRKTACDICRHPRQAGVAMPDFDLCQYQPAFISLAERNDPSMHVRAPAE